MPCVANSLPQSREKDLYSSWKHQASLYAQRERERDKLDDCQNACQTTELVELINSEVS